MDLGRHVRLLLVLVLAVIRVGKISAIEFNVVIVQPLNAEYEWTDTSLAHVTMDQIEPAVQLAIKSVGEVGMLGQHNFTTHTVDSECSHYMTLVRLVDLYYKAKVRPDVLIGPTCTYAVGHAGRLASHWDVPIISAGGQPSALRNKTGGYHGEYKTLTRMGVTYNKMANVVVELLWRYNWNRVALVHYDARNQQNDCKYSAQAFKEKLERVRSNNTDGERIPVDKDPINLVLDKSYDKDANLSYDSFLGELAEKARVVITCTPISDLQEMMRAAKERKMTDGDYVFIAIDPEFEGMYYGTHLWKTGPVGLWPLNTNTNDVSKSYRYVPTNKNKPWDWFSNNNHGSKSDQSRQSDPSDFTDSYMDIPNTDGGVLDVRQSLTVLANVRPDGINGTIFSYNVNGSGWGVQLSLLDGTRLSARFARINGTPLKPFSTDKDVINKTEWNYVGLTYDNRTGFAKLWHDGKEVARQSIGIVDLRTQGPITVGEMFQGHITCLQVYDYAMDEGQMDRARTACEDGSSDEQNLIQAFRSVIAITLRKPEFPDFVQQLAERGVKENHYVTAYHDSMVLFATALNETIAAGHDPADLKRNGSLILQNMWNRTFQGAGKDNISIDSMGDRDTDYSIVEMKWPSGQFEPILDYMGFTRTLNNVSAQKMDWPGDKEPNTEPCGLQGYDSIAGTAPCPADVDPVTIILCSVIAVLLVFVGLSLTYVWWTRRNDQELDRARRMLIVPKENIIFCGGRMQPGASIVLLNERSNLPRRDSNLSLDGQMHSQQFADTGYCKVEDEATGNTQWQRVRIKKTCYTGVVQISDREIVLELKEMRDLSNSHDHLVRFVGVCREHFDNPTMILTEYCPKGSLMDVLQDERVRLDWVFQCNLMNDIIKGMRHIHSSKMRSHGNLTSSNCLVDARFAVKIGDFGLPSFRSSLGEGRRASDASSSNGEKTHAFYEKRLWCAPELLRQENAPKEGTQKGDIYSFGIIMQEIMLRKGPFFIKEDEWMMAKVKVERIMLRKTDSSGGLFRPTLPTLDDMEDIELEDDIQTVNSNANPAIPDLSQNSNSPAKDKVAHSNPRNVETMPLVPPKSDKMKDRRKEMMRRFLEEVQRLMSECWHEDPIQRPDFNHLFSHVRKFLGRDKTLVDNLLGRMQKIVSNLETIVDQRTLELRQEKERSDMLLYRMLPTSIAEQLKAEKKVQAERFESVTIYFSDIVGFTALVHKMKPMEVVTLLDDLYKMFDQIIEAFDVYKVETIGDAYMLVSGLPRKNGTEHVKEIARSSLGILREVSGFKIRNRPDEVLKIRIGMHTGECAAGVVGETMPRYCLFGDTVNIASRMESTGEAMKIHVSEDSQKLLAPAATFKLDYRGLTTVKGRPHPMKTYWLIEEKVVAVPNGNVTGTEHSRSLPQSPVAKHNPPEENALHNPVAPPSRSVAQPTGAPLYYSVETVC